MSPFSPPKRYPVPGRPGLFSSYQWHPGMKDDVILRVSKSSLGDFGFCQQQSFIKRILGIKSEENDAMIRGSNVHDSVERFYQDVSVSYAASMRSYGIENVLKYFMEFVGEGDPKRGPYVLDEQVHLEKYMRLEAERFMNCEDAQFFLPLGNEISLDAVVTIEGQLVHLTGIVDRLFADAEGVPHVHELKTGMWKDHKPSKWTNMREEMAYYVYLLEESDHDVVGGLRCERWGWDHTGGYASKEGEEPGAVWRGVEDVRQKDIDSMKDKLKLLVKTYNQYKGDLDGRAFALIDFWRAQEVICEPWCDLKGYCPRYEKVLWPYPSED